MNKIFLAALAVPFLVVTSQAQSKSTVTMYGVVDTGVGYEQQKGNDLAGGGGKQSRFGLYDQGFMGNRLGLKGSEDLGNGLKANFVLEMGFDLSQGTQRLNRLFGRQAYMGLQSNSWGRVDLGRQVTVTSQYFSPVVSPFGGNGYQYGVGAAFASSNTVRYDNVVSYQTPNFSGFQLGAGYSFNTNGPQRFKQSDLPAGVLDSDQANVKAFSLAARYTSGPIKAVATFDQARHGDAREINGVLIPADSGKVTAWNVGASYDFEVVKVQAGFGQSRNGFIGNSLQTRQLGGGLRKGLKVNAYALGATIPVGKTGALLASWNMADPRAMPKATNDSSKQQVYSLGYRHKLSKRTSLYTIGSYARNVGFYNDLKTSVVTAGVSHSF